MDYLKERLLERTLNGIHHVSMIASDPQRNLDFYTGTLGMRLVKVTVNFDAPNAYHLYYGDGAGSPGTLMTFFPHPRARAGRHGSGQAVVTALAIAPSSLGYWIDRLMAIGTTFEGPIVRGTARVLAFKDPDGLMLELVTDPSAELAAAWAGSPVPAEHQIRRIAGVTLWEDPAEPTMQFLADGLGFEVGPSDSGVTRYTSNGQYVDVRSVSGFWSGIGAAGTVHHVAWRVPDHERLRAWRSTLTTLSPDVTMVQDRNYFHSIYFHEPGGVLFEIATDGPGFAIDETPEDLGTALKLPARYEAQRDQIVQALPALTLPGVSVPKTTVLDFIHRWVPSEADGQVPTLLLLHGTGRSEDDLLGLGSKLLPGAALLAPRGKVSEHGAARFFRRLAEGVFDIEDLIERTNELADFVEQAATEYGFDPANVIAVGYSNGANIASSMMLLRPGALAGAVLLRPMVPLEPDVAPDLTGLPVYIGAGQTDPLVPAANVVHLVDLLKRYGANVSLNWQPTGHGLTREDVLSPRSWIERVMRTE